MRGPLVGLTDEQLLDIAEDLAVNTEPGASPAGFTVTTPLELIVSPLAKSVDGHLQDLRRRVSVTTPLVLLSEAIERLQLRVVLAARYGNRAARALVNLDVLIEMAAGPCGSHCPTGTSAIWAIPRPPTTRPYRRG